MTLSNVRLIMAREVRDQLRDRRTLFVILVLPIMLYPLLGMSFMQLTSFMQEKPSKIYVVGYEDLGSIPPLFDGNQVSEKLVGDPARARLFDITFDQHERQKPDGTIETITIDDVKKKVLSGQYDAALYFPPDFTDRLYRFRRSIQQRNEETSPAEEIMSDEAAENRSDDRTKRRRIDSERLENDRPEKAISVQKMETKVPQPEELFTSANEKSQIAFVRLHDALQRWIDAIGEHNLKATGIPTTAVHPFDFSKADVAEETGLRGAAVWAKLLPVLLLLWALTGAFYPAIDLCAGEKERGTLETLLSSPAHRSEIVVGKLLTVMFFSMFTAILNMVSIGATGLLVASKLPNLGPPPAMGVVWMLLLLIPVSALFSALCLALAAFAKSTKEGQYYLMPLLLITMPLVVMPMSPGVELNLGNSLIPITGVVLLLRGMLEGNFIDTLPYIPVVLGVTMLACAVSIRWAIDQFNSESVLFRESERFDLKLWMVHLLRDRQPTPNVGGALFAAMLILMMKFVFPLMLPPNANILVATAVTLIAVVLTPALFMTLFFTSSPRRTLLLNFPEGMAILTLPAAFILALLMHPVLMQLQMWVNYLYPIPQSTIEQLKPFGDYMRQAHLLPVLLVIAFMPAVFEELAFRGFILSGFRHVGYKWRAIVLTSFFFALAHGILQQSMMAFCSGLIIGYIAVQTGSILPCMIYHFTNNALMVLLGRITNEMMEKWPILKSLFVLTNDSEVGYPPQLTIACAAIALALLFWLGRLPYSKSSEERLQDAIRREGGEDEDDDIARKLADLIK